MKVPILGSLFGKDTKKSQNSQNNTANSISQAHLQAMELVDQTDDLTGLTVTSLLGTGENTARTRQQIYQSFMQMEKDPIIATALKTHAIAALGGHESQGDVVFIQPNSDITEKDELLINELKEDLKDIFNDIAFNITYNAIAFGDAYARTYYEQGKGLVHCTADEQTHPMLVVPYEQAGKTQGFLVGQNDTHLARLTRLQMARMKMPRVSWIPQMGVLPKAFKTNISEDDVSKLPYLPSMIGGSFLFAAEKPYRNFQVSLNSLVGQRLVDSIDEAFITVNMTGSTKEQQKKFAANLKNILTMSKDIADKAMKGEPFLGRKRHVLFTHNEKQFTTHGDSLASKRQGNVSIEDIMLNAKLLAGSLGIDLSMLGFAEILSGGLGEGGFFRASVQIAESSRLIRRSLAKFFNEIIDNHCLYKYGKKLAREDRPFTINFYGSISAFESEKEQTKANAINNALMLTQAMSGVKDLGLPEKEMVTFFNKQLKLEEDEAEVYAKAILSKKEGEEEGY